MIRPLMPAGEQADSPFETPAPAYRGDCRAEIEFLTAAFAPDLQAGFALSALS